MSPRKTAASGSDLSAQHAWNASTAGSRALDGPGTVTAAIPNTGPQKLRAALALALLAADDADVRRELLDAAGLDLAELRALRAARSTDSHTSGD